MMNTKALKTTAIMFILSFISALLVQACSTGSDAIAQTSVQDVADKIEGTWDARVTLTNCQTGAAVAMFPALAMFHRGGTLSDTNNLPTMLRTPGFGTWQRTATANQYTAVFRFFRFNPDGTWAGVQKVSRTITLSADTNTQTAVIAVEVQDQNGVVLQNVCGVASSTRLL